MSIRLGFFTRVLDQATPPERYRLALEQIVHAEKSGFDSIWLAQHHFHEQEGGLPSPLVFLAHAAARTERVRLGTGIITLPMEQPIRVAEDAVVADILSGERIELGFGSGGTPSSFIPFGTSTEERRAKYDEHLATVTTALAGGPVAGAPERLYPAGGSLGQRVWEATFSAAGAAAAGARGNGLLLSRAQPPTPETEGLSFVEIQHRIVDAYLEKLPAGVQPRILASRAAFVADTEAEANRWVEIGLASFRERLARSGRTLPAGDLEKSLAAANAYAGSPDRVIELLSADSVIERATEVTFQVHPIDPPHEQILRHIELLGATVAPAFGWGVHLGATAAAGAPV